MAEISIYAVIAIAYFADIIGEDTFWIGFAHFIAYVLLVLLKIKRHRQKKD